MHQWLEATAAFLLTSCSSDCGRPAPGDERWLTEEFLAGRSAHDTHPLRHLASKRCFTMNNALLAHRAKREEGCSRRQAAPAPEKDAPAVKERAEPNQGGGARASISRAAAFFTRKAAPISSAPPSEREARDGGIGGQRKVKPVAVPIDALPARNATSAGAAVNGGGKKPSVLVVPRRFVAVSSANGRAAGRRRAARRGGTRARPRQRRRRSAAGARAAAAAAGAARHASSAPTTPNGKAAAAAAADLLPAAQGLAASQALLGGVPSDAPPERPSLPTRLYAQVGLGCEPCNCLLLASLSLASPC